jgi:hypothetical protein
MPVPSTTQLDAARAKFCPKSPIWYKGFCIQDHRKEMRMEMEREQEAMGKQQRKEAAEKKRLEEAIGELFPASRPIREAFDGRSFIGDSYSDPSTRNFTSVLYHRTIFTSQWDIGKGDVANWPSKHETEYEGDGRTATDALHRRFLPLPRVDTKDLRQNWQQRAQIDPYVLDDIYNRPQWDHTFWQEGTPFVFGYNPLHVNWEDAR